MRKAISVTTAVELVTEACGWGGPDLLPDGGDVLLQLRQLLQHLVAVDGRVGEVATVQHRQHGQQLLVQLLHRALQLRRHPCHVGRAEAPNCPTGPSPPVTQQP